MTNIDKSSFEFTNPIPAITLKSDRVEVKKRYFIPGISDCEGIINLEDRDVECLITTSKKSSGSRINLTNHSGNMMGHRLS